MPRLTLYFAPGTCTRATLIALEEIGAPFETSLLRFPMGEHKAPQYLQLHPRGKVPTLLVDDRPLTENLAIFTYLARTFPQAKLLPAAKDAFSDALVLADISWCTSTIHPIVTRIVLPQLFCDGQGRERTWNLAIEAMKPQFALINERLAKQEWMLGDWSVLDGYVYWMWDQILLGGFDSTPYPHVAAHAKKMVQRDSVQRALARESAAEKAMEAQGLPTKLPPPPRSH